MIAVLAGTILSKDGQAMIIDVAGVGYEVSTTTKILALVNVGSSVQFWTHEHIREDTRDLYGFSSRADLKVFKKLLSVSGVGPKIGLAILSLGGAADIEKHIETSNLAWLTSISGVGTKIAQKIILELRGKLVDKDNDVNHDLVNALMDMGYSREITRSALSRIGFEGTVEERLKKALRELARV